MRKQYRWSGARTPQTPKGFASTSEEAGSTSKEAGTEAVSSQKRLASQCLTPSATPKKVDLKDTPFRPCPSEEESSGSFATPFQHTLEQVCTYLTDSKYGPAFRLLWAESKAARRALLETVFQAVRQEILQVTRPGRSRSIKSLQGTLSMEKLTSFTWNEVVEECVEKIPITAGFIDAALPSVSQIRRHTLCGRKSQRRLISPDSAGDRREAKLGFLLSNVLYHKAPRIYRLPQAAVAVELWRQGASGKALGFLHTFGICQGVGAARAVADAISGKFDEQLQGIKAEIQNKFDRDALPAIRRRLQFSPQKSFSLGWDNVQVESRRKHQGLSGSNKFLMWAMCYSVVHRLPSLHLNSDMGILAAEVQPSKLLPSPIDWGDLRLRQVVIVQRILTRHMDAFQELKGTVPKHVPHMHSAEMANRSEVINLGTIEANPASTAGVIDIMEHLGRYIPSGQEWVCRIPVNGDQLSVERMINAKRARALGPSPMDRMEWVVESPQEFHKEGILLQVAM